MLLLTLVALPPNAGASTMDFAKLPDPATPPSGNAHNIAWSPEGTHLAVAHANLPYVTIYRRDGTALNKLPNPTSLPDGVGAGVCWNGQGTKFAVTVTTGPGTYLRTYGILGLSITSDPAPNIAPAGPATGCDFADNGDIYVSHVASPYVSVFGWNPAESRYEKRNITFVGGSPAGTANGVAWVASASGVFLAIAHAGSPGFSTYSAGAGDTWFRIGTPSSGLPDAGNGVSWTSDASFLAVAHNAHPYLSVYQRTGFNETSTLVKLDDPVTTPPADASDLIWDPSDRLLVVAHSTHPFITVYERNGLALTKLMNPSALPPNTGSDVSWIPGLVAVSHVGAPYLTTYATNLGATPSKPTEVIAIEGDRKVDLSWSAPTYDGGAAITHYVVFRSSSEGSLGSLRASPMSPSFVDEGADGPRAGRTHFYTIAAVSAFGQGDLSPQISSTPYEVPRGFVVENHTSGPILRWLAAEDARTSGYRVYRNGSILHEIDDATVSSYQDGLTVVGVSYAYAMTSRGTYGETPHAGPTSGSRLEPRIALVHPSEGNSYTSNDGEAFATTASADTTGTWERVEYRLDSPVGIPLSTASHPPWRSEVSLPAGARTLCAVAVNSTGGTLSDCHSFSVVATAPSAPSELQVDSADIAGSLKLQWSAATPAPGSDISEYRIYRSAASGAPFIPVGATTGLTYTDAGLATGTYRYVVRAANSANNEGPPSNEDPGETSWTTDLVDGFNATDYAPESPTGNTPFGGVALHPTFPGAAIGDGTIDLANGEFVATFPLLHSDMHLGEDLDLALTYRSIGHAGGNKSLSWRWDANWLQSLVPNGTDYLLRTGDGRLLRFKAAVGGWEGPSGTYQRISDVNGTLELRDRYDHRQIFDPAQGLALTARIDAAGNAWNLSYGASGELRTLSDPTGRAVVFEYDPWLASSINPFWTLNGQPILSKITDWTGREVALEYNASTGELIGIRTPGATVGEFISTHLDHDPEHRLVAIRDGLDVYTLRIDYDAQGRVAAERGAGGRGAYLRYYYGSGITLLQDGNANLKEWRFLSEGESDPRMVPAAMIEHTRGLRAKDPANFTTTYTHNVQDERTSIAFPRGNSISYEYDGSSSSFFARGNLLSETRSPGSVTTSPSQLTAQMQITTKYAYHPICNRPTSIVDPRGTDGTFTPPNGGATSEDRYTTRITYNAACLPVRIDHPVVNPEGSPDPAFTSSYENQVVTESFTYNDAGQLLTHTDANGSVVARTYHTEPSSPGKPEGFLASVTTDPGLVPHLALTTRFEYADFGVITKITDPNRNVRLYDVDLRGRTVQEIGPAVGLPAASIRTNWTFDANDRIVSAARETGPGSGSYTLSTYAYDGAGHLVAESTQLSDQSTVVVRNAYDGNGGRTSRVSGSGEVRSWTYDERDQLLTQSGPDGGTYAYDLNGNLASRTDPLGHLTSYQFDGYDRLAVETNAQQSQIITSYDPAGNVVAVRGHGGTSGRVLFAREYDHDELGRVYRSQEWMQSADTMPLATGGTLGPGGQWVNDLREYDPAGRIVRAINDNGHVVSATYDALGRVTVTRSASGDRAETTYDGNGNVVRRTTIVAGAVTSQCPEVCVTNLHYDAEDRLTSVVNPDGSTRTYAYDGRDNLLKSTDENGNIILHAYDDADRRISTRRSTQAAPTGYVTTTTVWDAEGRVASQCDDAGQCTNFTYVPATDLIATEEPTTGPRVNNTYDAGGNLRTIERSSGTNVSLTYDTLDRLVTVDLSGGSRTLGTTRQQFTYDDLGRVIEATDDGIGSLGTGLAATLDTITVTQDHDTLGRVIGEAQLGLPVAHSYDGVGNVLWTTYPSADGRPVGRSYDVDEMLDRVWDAKGLIVDYDYQGDRVREKAFGGPVPDRPAQGTIDPVVKTTIARDDRGREANIRHERADGDLLASLTTRFDAAGNRAAQKIQGNSPGPATDKHSQLYALDSLYRTTSWLRGVLTNSSPSTPFDTIASPLARSSWPTIDGTNNWIEWSNGTGSCARSTQTSGTPPTRHVTDSCPNGVTEYAFDANGNLVSDGTYTYRWDLLDRLVRVEDAAGDLVVGYGYDAFDRRVVKVFANQETPLLPGQQGDGEAWYTFAGHHVIQESQPFGSILPQTLPPTPPGIHIIRQWAYGPRTDEALVMDVDANANGFSAIDADDARYFYVYDSGANVLGLMSDTGHLVEGYAYQPYGAVTILLPGAGATDVKWDGTDKISTGPYGTDPTPRPHSPSGNLWFFTGRQYDPEIGLYNYRARHYHPELGQFISLDPTGAWGDSVSLGNPYAYVGNNPGSWTDPSGRCPQCLVLGGIWLVATASALAIDAASYGYEVVSTGRSWDHDVARDRFTQDFHNSAEFALLLAGESVGHTPASPGRAAVASAADADASVTRVIAVSAGRSAQTHGGAAGTASLARPISSGRLVSVPVGLEQSQASSYVRFAKKLPVGHDAILTFELPGGGKAFQSSVPGRVSGSYAVYEKQVSFTGETLQYTKTTYDPLGHIIHVKDKLRR